MSRIVIDPSTGTISAFGPDVVGRGSDFDTSILAPGVSLADVVNSNPIGAQHGAGSPEGSVGARHAKDLYYRTSDSHVWYHAGASGTTGWVDATTVIVPAGQPEVDAHNADPASHQALVTAGTTETAARIAGDATSVTTAAGDATAKVATETTARAAAATAHNTDAGAHSNLPYVPLGEAGVTLGISSIVGDDLAVDFDTHWGIDVDGPYYDTDASVIPDDEAAVLLSDLTVVKPGDNGLAAPAGASVPAITPATPPAGSFTTPNPYTATGTIDVETFGTPGNPDVALALGTDADAFPSVVVVSNGHGGMWFADGTVDPLAQGAGFQTGFGAAPDLSISGGHTFVDVGVGADGTDTQVGGDLLINPTHGVVLYSPDNTKYRLLVANDGTLSTEVVA